jgi:hypothetical protein
MDAMTDEARRDLDTLSRAGRPSTALARLQRYLGQPELARESFREAAIRLGEQAAGLVVRDGLPQAAAACISVGEAWLEAGETSGATRAVTDLVPYAGELAAEDRARLGFLLVRAGETETGRQVLGLVTEGGVGEAGAAVIRGDRQRAAGVLEETVRARPADAKPWADSSWWDVIGWLRAA